MSRENKFVALIAVAMFGGTLAAGLIFSRHDASPIRIIGFSLVVTVPVCASLYGILRRRFSKPISVMRKRCVALCDDCGGATASASTDEITRMARALNGVAAAIKSMKAENEGLRAEITDSLNSIHDGVVIVDQNRKVLVANDAAYEMLQKSRRDYIGRPFIELTHDQRINRLLSRAFEEKILCEMEMEIELFSKRVALVRAYPYIDETRHAARGVIILRDISESRRRETIRREFIENASHELRTPVAIIRGIVETLAGGAADDPEASKRFLARLDAETARLAQLTEDILALEKAEKAQNTQESETFDAATEFKACGERFAERMEEKGLRLTIESPESPMILKMPREDFRRIFSNLIDNAVKFTDEGGVALKLEELGDKAFFTVADTGEGIPATHCDRIFERFYRVDKSHSREKGGTGLGLSIVKHLAENHGGGVSVYSVPGKGAEFRVVLPFTRA